MRRSARTCHAPVGHGCESQQSITRQPAAGLSSRSVADRWRRCVAFISHNHPTVQPCEAHKWRHLTPVWSWKVISTPCRSSSWQGGIKGEQRTAGQAQKGLKGRTTQGCAEGGRRRARCSTRGHPQHTLPHTCSTPGGLPGVPFVQQSCTATAMPQPTLAIVSLHVVHLLQRMNRRGRWAVSRQQQRAAPLGHTRPPASNNDCKLLLTHARSSRAR